MIPRSAAINASVRRQQAARRAAAERQKHKQQQAAKPKTVANSTPSAQVIVAEDEPDLTSKDKEFLHAQLHKYDADHSGFLEPQEVSNLMRDLNDGIPPPAEEVAAVIKEADKSGDGKISADELKHLISVWFASVEVKEEANSGGCCTVM